MNRCLGCMKEKDEYSSVCPHCGYVEGSAPDEIYHLTPGHFIHNKYVVGKALGYSDNTVTYIGMDYITDKTVIIKEFVPLEFSTRLPGECGITVYKGEASDKFTAGINDFAQKAMKLVNLNSFNYSEDGIAPFDIFMENNTCYVVEEYGEGESLENIILQCGTMPYESAAAVMTGVIKLVSYLHSECICHGNLTADSIVITPDNKIRLLNFSYTSGDTASDVFGIASILYRAITGIDVCTVEDFANLTSPLRLGVNIPTSANSAIILALKSKGNVTLSDFGKKICDKNDLVFEEKNENVPVTKSEKKKGKKKVIIISAIIAALLIICGVLGFVISNNMAKAFDSSINVKYSLDGGETFTELVFSADETKTDFNANMSEKNFDKDMLGDAQNIIFRISKSNEDTKVTLKCDDVEIQGNVGKNENNVVYTEYVVDITDKDLCKITIESKGSVFVSSNKTTYAITCTKEAFAKLDNLTVMVGDADFIDFDPNQFIYSGIQVETGKQVVVGYSAPDTHNVKVTLGDKEIKENPVIINVNDEATWSFTLKVTADGYKENTYTVKIKGVKKEEKKEEPKKEEKKEPAKTTNPPEKEREKEPEKTEEVEMVKIPNLLNRSIEGLRDKTKEGFKVKKTSLGTVKSGTDPLVVVSQKVYDNNGKYYSVGDKVPKDHVGNITIEIKYYEP